MDKKTTRVRFAPSPTGFLHVGGLRTAFYNFLFVRQTKGQMVLRIEDTDRNRYVEGATENLIKILSEMGIDYDEGPVVKNINGKDAVVGEKGDCGPYIQSERLKIYGEHARTLVDSGKAYHCFCLPETLEKMRSEQMARKEAPRYDGRCRHLKSEEISKRIENKEPCVIRLKVPETGEIKFKDAVRGEVKFDCANVDDQVLMKSDGYPTYHLANVIDDRLMDITDVIRGEEWLPSTPKHILIYQAFGWEAPNFAHLPLLLNPDKSKLSKRQGDVAVEDFLAKGYLPEAIVNFIALLGWNPGTEQEIFSLKELVKDFSLSQVQKAGAVFNLDKLDWINGQYIRKMNLKELAEKCVPFLETAGLIRKYDEKNIMISETGEMKDMDFLEKVVGLEQERMKKLGEISDLADFFFREKAEYDPALLIWKKIGKEDLAKSLSVSKKALQSFEEKDFSRQNIEKSLMAKAEETGTGELLWPLRVALSGKKGSPGPFEIAELLGKEKTLARIEAALGKI